MHSTALNRESYQGTMHSTTLNREMLCGFLDQTRSYQGARSYQVTMHSTALNRESYQGTMHSTTLNGVAELNTPVTPNMWNG